MTEDLRGTTPLARVAWWLRCLADRIDPAHAPRGLGRWFTFERGRGLVVNEEERGCRLWYMGDASYERAHTEARDPT